MVNEIAFVEPVIVCLNKTIELYEEFQNLDELDEGIQEYIDEATQTKRTTFTDKVTYLFGVGQQRRKELSGKIGLQE